MEFLIESGAECDAVDATGRSALHYAAGRSCYETVVKLVRQGCDVNRADQHGCTPFHYACKNDLEGQVVEFLLTVVENPLALDHRGHDALRWASAKGNATAVLMVLTHRAGIVFDQDCIYQAAQGGYDDTLKILLSHSCDAINARNAESKWTPLEVACRHGHEDAVKTLLEFGASYLVPRGNQTPLHLAAKSGHVACVHLLLKHITDPSAIVDLKAQKGRTPLMVAAANDQTEVCQTLIDYGCDVNVQTGKGLTALYMAVSFDVLFF